MKPEILMGATVVDVVGEEGLGCLCCGIDPGELNVRKITLQVDSGEWVIMVVGGGCNNEETRLTCVGVVSSQTEGE